MGGGIHVPSGPAGLVATGTYCPSRETSATVTHHGISLGEMLVLGEMLALGAEGAGIVLARHAADELAGACNEDTLRDGVGGMNIVEVNVTVTVSL